MRRVLKSICLLGILSVASAVSADVRVLHLSPDAPNVDVLFGAADDMKSEILSDVAFLGVSPYIPVDSGDYFIDVVPSAGGDPVIDVNGLGIDGSTDYSIAAVNTLSSIEPLVLVDDNTIDPTMARLRVVHASPDAGPVDISVDGLGTVLSGFDFKDASSYLSVPGGEYTVRISPVGSEAEVVVPGLVLDEGTVYSAFAAGLLSGTGDQAFRVLPTVDAVPEPSSSIMMVLAGFVFALRLRRRA